MPAIEPYRPAHLDQLTGLVNAHLSTAMPGLALTRGRLASSLVDEPGQPVLNPWVAERVTLCAVERDQVLAAAHALRYGDGPRVWADHYRGAADVAWLVAWPTRPAAGAALAEAVMDRVRSWRPRHVYAGDFGLPVPALGLVPASWPHVTELLAGVGFRPDEREGELVMGGRVDAVAPPGEPPVPGLTVTRTVGYLGVRFTALVDGAPVGRCEWELPDPDAARAPAAWAELGDLGVDAGWRGRGIGGWLLRHSVGWLRLAGCDRILLVVAPDDEAAGAGRFYRRLGMEPLSRALQLGPHPDWPAPSPPAYRVQEHAEDRGREASGDAVRAST